MAFARIRKLLKSRRGQSVTEYILILSVVVLIALKFKDLIGKQISDATGTVGDRINRALSDDNF